MARTASWLRDVSRLAVLYMAVGLAFIPWGIVYAFAAVWGWRDPLLTIALLAGGSKQE